MDTVESLALEIEELKGELSRVREFSNQQFDACRATASRCLQEAVRATDPEVYAEAILSVCKLYLESPLVCLSGATGANLKNSLLTL